MGDRPEQHRSMVHGRLRRMVRTRATPPSFCSSISICPTASQCRACALGSRATAVAPTPPRSCSSASIHIARAMKTSQQSMHDFERHPKLSTSMRTRSLAESLSYARHLAAQEYAPCQHASTSRTIHPSMIEQICSAGTSSSKLKKKRHHGETRHQRNP